MEREPTAYRSLLMVARAADDWLCPPCIEQELHIIKSIDRKRTHSGKVEYLVRWVGHGAWETWQKFQDIPPGSRNLVAKFNASMRA